MYGFAHRKDIFTSMTKAIENSVLTTISGQVNVEVGNWVCTNLDGDRLIVSDAYVDAMKQVKVVTSPTRKKAPEGLASEYMRQLSEMPMLQQDESELWGK